MVGYLWQGVRAGLLLSLLVGPLMILLVQLSLRRGTLASFAAALGIWTSDIGLISFAHYALDDLDQLLDYPNFNFIAGTVGSLILLGVGVAMWFRQPPSLDRRMLPGKRGLMSSWLQGFAVNTFNPFTFFFWSTFVVTQVHDQDLPPPQAGAIYLGIIGVIILSDSAKVLGARKLREWLNPQHMLQAQRAGAVALGVFGIVLALRVWL